MNNAINQFKEAMTAAGLVPPASIEPGKMHRFPGVGKTNGNAAGWCKLFDDGLGGSFGDWSTGISENWQAQRATPFSDQEKADFNRHAAEAKRQSELERQARYAAAAKAALAVWESAPPSDDKHAYLAGKGVMAHGLRQHDGKVIVPLRDVDGVLHSLQSIDGNGNKRFYPGGRVAGCFCSIGSMEEARVICIAEGFATGASVYESTGYPTVIAFNCGNLIAVAEAIRAKYPNAKIVLCADDDAGTDGNPGLTKAIEAAEAVNGLVAVPDFGDNRPKGATDFNDMVQLRGTGVVRARVDLALANGAAPMQSPANSAGTIPATDKAASDEDEQEKESQASAMVKFVETRTVLFHDENKDVYAVDNETRETRRIDSRSFRDWLVAGFYDATDKAPRDQSVREALSTLSGIGRFRGECHDVNVRVAKHGDAYYVDLAEPGTSRAVCIEPGSVRVVDRPPVRFIRSDAMRPLPCPESGGDIAALWQIANIPESARCLVLAWLLECLRPETPYPVLELIGEQGSAKSTAQTALRRLIDPNACDLRAAPKSVEDVFVGAGASYLVSYENISHLPAPMQDAFCVLATGGGFAKRKLYSDADESVIKVKRPIVLNGIVVAVTAQDLIDRTLTVEMPVISERQETTDLWKTFDADHGRLFGALLDLMAKTLAKLPGIHLAAAERPRLAEFARLGMAVSEAMDGQGADFLKQFNASREEAIARTIDASPVAAAVLEWFEKNPHGRTDTAKALLQEVEKFKPPYCDSWPRSAKGFGDALRRSAPALRTLGIECKCLGKSGGNVRWSIGPRGKLSKPSPESPNVLAEAPSEQDFRTSRTWSRLISPAQTGEREVIEL